MKDSVYSFALEQLNELLCLTTEPLLVWSVIERRVKKRNASAERFALVSQGLGESELSDLDRSLPDWKMISLPSAHSLWMDFPLRSGEVRRIQVRSFCVDPEDGLWASLLTDASQEEARNDGKERFFLEFENLWARLSTCSESAAAELIISDLERLSARAMRLTDFGFYPGDAFDVVSTAEILRNSTLWRENRPLVAENVEKIKLYPYEQFLSLEDFPQGCGFYTLPMNGKTLGFFYWEGLETETPDAFMEAVLSFIRGHIEALCRQKCLERENYLASFESLFNDAVLSDISEGVIITDEALSVMHINPVASLMFGFPNRQVIGHPLSDLLVTSEGLHSIVGEERSDRDVKYFHRRSGELFPCSIKSRQVTSDGVQYHIFILSDETESEDSRLRSEQLTQRAFLGDFASLMAHEIRNPINNMRIWLANIESCSQGNEAVISAIHRIDDDCQRISELVSNILSFSKPVALNREEVDLAMLISDVIEKWKLNFVRKNITCYFSPPEDFPKIMGDPRTLEQVLVNLISNSVDALGDAGGVITLRLTVKEQPGGRRYIQITESDNGPGIPADKIDHIFEPFMTTKKNGNGWGLALSKKIITSHKGTIRANSFSGGTVFEILLPLPDGRG